MHILHLTPYYTPAYAFGGVTRSAEGMARTLAQLGHRVTVLTTDALDQSTRYSGPADEMRDGVRVVRAPNLLPVLRDRLNLSTPIHLQSLARDLLADADIVHCHEFRTVENLLVTPTAKRLNKPLLLSPHGTLALNTGRSILKSAWDALLSPVVVPHFDHVVGLTQTEVDEAALLWAKFSASATFSVVPNGVNPNEYANLHGRDTFRQRYALGDGPVCLFMARLHPRKGAHLLAEAFLQANIADAHLVIAGPDEGGQHLIPDHPGIILTGYLSGADRLAAFAAADFFCLPAVGEGLPMVVLEAMAAGLPVIVSPGCNLPEVEPYNAGLVVEPQVEALAAALHDLLSNAERRKAMGTAAQNLVKECFTWDSVAVKLERIYHSLL